MNPYQSEGSGDDKAKRNRKRRSVNTTVEIKQEEVVKEELRNGIEMVDVPQPPRKLPSTEAIAAIKLDWDTDSERYSEHYANYLKKEVKNEDECSKKESNSEEDEGCNGGDGLDDVAVGENVANPGPSSRSKGEKKKQPKVKEKKPCDRRKKTNARASKKAAVKRQKKHHCHLCNYATSDKTMLTRHIRVHTGEKPYGCKVCAKSFTQKGDLTRHEKMHSGEKPFKCSVCSKVFSRKFTLRRHSRTHKKQLLFACSLCGQRFVDENKKLLHEKRCNGRRFECYLCQYKSFHGVSLKRHMRLKHTGEKPFECAVCDMKFGQKYELKQHLATHAKPRPIRCSKCWIRFTEEGKKDAHEERCNRRLNQCYLCKFNAIGTTQLKNHMRAQHTGEKPFRCAFCKACFVLKIHADCHVKRHHNLKN